MSRTEDRAARRKHIVADVLIGLIVTALLITVKWFGEHTVIGEQFEEAVYDVLQLRRESHLDPDTLPVVVIDIGPMPLIRHPDSRELDFTSRTGLEELVRDVAAQGPRSIGVDIDFTPERGPQLAADRAFLDAVLDLSGPNGKVPVFVAVHAAVDMGERVLGSLKYAKLAAFIGHPIPGEFDSPKKMVDWVEVDYVDDKKNATRRRFPSLASAVAQKYAEDPSRWLRWLLEKSTHSKEQLTYHEFIVDYSPLEALKTRTIAFNDPGITTSSELAGKIVLLGRPNAKEDQVTLPGRRGRRYGGVFVHGSAAYTLLSGPLLKLSTAGRIALDLSLALVVILAVALVRIWYLPVARDIRHGNVHTLFTAIVVFGVVLLGIYAVNVHRLMWDDSLFVAAALALHGLTERYTMKLWRPATGALTAAWRGLLFGRR